MNIPQGQLLKYGRGIFRQASNDQGAGNQDQTNWKAKYEELQGQIASGQYVTKDSYVTLQRNLETAVNEKKAAQGDLGTAQAKIVLLTETETNLKNQLTTFETDKQKLQNDLVIKDQKLERHNVIFKEFPHLATFEADKLLPTPDGDQKLEDVLKAFSDKLGIISTQKVEDYKKGDIGNPPEKKDTGITKTSATVFAEAKALSVTGDQKAYDAKMDEYHQLKAQETKTA